MNHMLFWGLVSSLALLSQPVLAQGAITIKKDDGTVEVFQLPDVPVAPAPAPIEIRPQAMPPVAPAAASPATSPATSPSAPPAASSTVSAPPAQHDMTKNPAPKETVVKKPAAKKPVEKKVSPKKESTQKTSAKKSSDKKYSNKKPAPQKPKSEAKILKDVPPPEPRIVPPGTVITPELAKSLALDYAPPARTTQVTRRVFEGRPVFVVTFMTETGAYDVLVDSESGRIVKKVQR